MLEKMINVFSYEYREETKYFDLKENMKDNIKLKNKSEKLEDKMNRLKNYDSKCNIKVGECV